MKIKECGMVLEEKKGKVSEELRILIKGKGYEVKI
jgi:hypothetical protein